MNARCHKEHALFNRLSSRRSTNNNNISASASACSFCGSLSAEMATAASHTCGEMQRKNQNKMQANVQECETARDAETQAQTATATAPAAVLSQRSCSPRWQWSLLSTSSSIAYAQIDSSAATATAARLVSCSAVVRRVGRVLWISFAHLTQLRARAESFDLLLVCVFVCVLCLQLLLLLFVNYTNYVQ